MTGERPTESTPAELYSLDCPTCGQCVFSQSEDEWLADQEEQCHGCGHLLIVCVDEQDEPPSASVMDLWEDYDASHSPAEIVFGSRDGVDPAIVATHVQTVWKHHVLILGGAPGVDQAALEAALARGMSVIVIPPQWDAYGRAAGPIRNAIMAKLADRGTAFRRYGVSRGTDDMSSRLRALGKAVEER